MLKKRTFNKKGYSEISDTSKVEVYRFGTNSGICKTEVYLQYHKHPEYATLFKDQGEELREWRLKNPNSKGRTKGWDNKLPNINKCIAAAMDKQVEKTLSAAIKSAKAEASHDAPTDDQSRSYIMSLQKDNKVETTSAKTILKKLTLKSILWKGQDVPQMTCPIGAILCIPPNAIQE